MWEKHIGAGKRLGFSPIFPANSKKEIIMARKPTRIDLGALQDAFDEATQAVADTLSAKREADANYMDAVIANSAASTALAKAAIEVSLKPLSKFQAQRSKSW